LAFLFLVDLLVACLLGAFLPGAFLLVAFLVEHRDLGTHLGASLGELRLGEVLRVPCLEGTFLLGGLPWAFL
jgi:hypothetical protein